MFTKSCWYHLALSSLLLVAGCQARVENGVPETADAPSVHDTGNGTSGNRDGASTGAQSGGTTGASSGTPPGGTDGGSGQHSGKPSGCTCDVGLSETPDGRVETPTDGGLSPGNDGSFEFPAEGGGPLRYDAVADVFDVLDVVDVKEVEPEVGLDGATTVADAADADESSVAADALVAETSARREYNYLVPAHGLVRVDLSTIDICDSCTLSAGVWPGGPVETLISGSLRIVDVSVIYGGRGQILARGPQFGKTLSLMNRRYGVGGPDDTRFWLYVDQATDSGVTPIGDAAVDADTALDAPQTAKRTLATYFLGTETVDLSTLDICPSCQLYASVGSCTPAKTQDIGFSGVVSIIFHREEMHPDSGTHPTNDVLLGDAIGPRTGSLTIKNSTAYLPVGSLTAWKECALAVSLWSKPVGS